MEDQLPHGTTLAAWLAGASSYVGYLIGACTLLLFFRGLRFLLTAIGKALD